MRQRVPERRGGRDLVSTLHTKDTVGGTGTGGRAKGVEDGVVAGVDVVLVGDEDARAVHGWSAGADVVVLGGGLTPVLRQALADLSLREPVTIEEPGAAGVLDLVSLARADLRRPLVLIGGDVELELPALLDLLDRPGSGTAAQTIRPEAVTEGLPHVIPVRVGADAAALESLGTDVHEVTGPDHALTGLVRIDAQDRERAAELWQSAGGRVDPGEARDTFALAVLALVRGGLRLRNRELGPFTWRRAGAFAQGHPGSAWEQRLRGASRGGDGYLSTRAIRPMSRRVTRFGLGRGWTPNLVSVASLTIGLLAAGLVTTDNRWLWIVAAVLLQVALVVDCVDGEIARFTRRFSAFGAWLDGVGDRVKEYAMFAALAFVAVRHGAPGWVVAGAAMILVTFRHLEDYAYVDRLRPLRASRPDVIPLTQERDGGSEGATTAFASAPTRRDATVHAVKKVIHFPIAERYLLISLGLLTFRPLVVLWAVIAAMAIALVWTQGGRTVKAVWGRDGITDDLLPGTGRWSDLDHQMDLGPLARVVGRISSMPVVGGLAAAAALYVAVIVAATQHQVLIALVVGIPVMVVLGAAARPPVSDPLGWQLPSVLWLAEALVVGSVTVAVVPEGARGAAYLWLAVVAYHRYDVVYRLRETGEGGAGWVALATLGVDGRVVGLLLVAFLAPELLSLVLWIGAAVLAVVYAVDSVLGWRRAAARQRAVTEAAMAGTP
ncbi:DUF5941 domain-containing protein [Segeticoccus rhizosphaerae]|uniref:DUF5941 domain-containing protein n=1 Tax=Segeticoccus rhizosphaerae TaxID=1104777 RepID=UPI0010BFAC2E|nr:MULTISPECIES: DUF5941 domain-containing protein [Intrasporangiaceae]